MPMTKRNKLEITKENLLNIFNYNKEEGKLYWKNPTGNRVQAGKEAGNIFKGHGTEYRQVCIQKKTIFTHRIIWFIETGSWPKYDIDHIDGNGLNNRFNNLRDVPPQENNKNGSKRCDNVSGITGISWNKAMQAWVVQIQVSGDNKYIGKIKCSCINHAIEMRKKASKEYGFHANHGKTII